MKTQWASAAVLALIVSVGGGALALLSSACGNPTAPSPFLLDATGGGAAAGGSGGAPSGGGVDVDPTLGGPCTFDEQCNDGFDCTFDSCDQELKRCRFVPDDSSCQNELYCDGLEVCDNKLGCILGEPISCSDGDPCTINQCDEQTKMCLSEPRDVDQDGDPDDHCGGGDCNDADPTVSSLQLEVCANARDDDCDDQIDESSCVSPMYDTCLDPLELVQTGTYAMTSAAASLNYAASCSVSNPTLARDLVAALTLPATTPFDVQLTARADASDLALALLGQCGSAASEIACSGGYPHPEGGRVAKLRGRSQGGAATETVLPAYIFAEQSTDLSLRFELLPATTKPTNETCSTTEVLQPSTPTVASVVDAVPDVSSGCAPATGDLVYKFDLLQTSNIDLYATSVDGDGLPVISLRDVDCSLPADEISCNVAANAHIFRHSLPVGTYFVSVAATAPTDVVLTLETSAPTPAPDGDDCSGTPPTLPHNQTIDVSFGGYQDDIDMGCLTGGVDAVYTLDLSVPSDVLLVGRFSQGDTAALLLAQAPCADANDQLLCGTGLTSPLRGALHNVPAGSYRVIAESLLGQAMQITALVRNAVPTTVVPFADNCTDALSMAATGGFFQGTTSNAQADFDAGCDYGAQPSGGAPDQLLKLVLAKSQRVVLDMQGSGYATLLDVREGPGCPGTEIPLACAIGFAAQRSYLDLTLPAATYYLQVDGYNGQTGPWFLDAHVVDP